MAKVTLNDIGTLANPASARQAINEQLQKIEDEFQKVVYRDGSTPNSMEADLDMNSKRVLNVADGTADSDAVNKRQMDTTIRKEVLDQVLTAVTNPNTELFVQDGNGTEARTISDVLRKDIMFSVSNTIPLSHSGDVRALIQAALNEAATSARAGRREVAFRARGLYQISNFLTVPSGTRLIFDGDGRMMPTTSSVDVGTGNGLRSYGSLPVTTYAPASDISFGDYKIPAGVYAALFAVGDYVWLGSSLVIATSPNTQNVTRAQMAKVIAVDGTNLVLDRMIEYDFPAATTTFGKADIVSGVRVENFVWGDPSMDIISGRGIDFRFHDDLKIIGSDIGWSRDTPQLGSAYDKQNVNAINLSCCSNVEIDGLKATRVGWYGVSLNGACHNVRVRGLDARMVRHGLSLNWNGPGEPIHVTVEDSAASLTTEAGFDTHDVGRDITFRKLRVTGSNGPGVQARTSNVTIDDVAVDACAGSGFLVYGTDSTALGRLYNVTLSKIRARSCVNGVLSMVGVKISDASISRCSGTGISTNGGSINVARIVDSNVAIMYRPGVAYDANMVPLTVRDVDAPASSNQTYFLRATKAFTDRDLKLRDVRAVGYDADKIVSRTDATYIADIDHRGCTFGTDPRQGTVALVGGTATIMNNNIVVPASATLTRVFRSNVDVQRLVDGGTVGSYTVTLSTGQIVITSSSNTDTSTVEWRII